MAKFIKHTYYPNFSCDEMLEKAKGFNAHIQKRRTVRHFSDEAVDQTIIEACIKAAASAPSGAHQQPWHFVAIKDAEIKKQIRIAAEIEEKEFYQHRASEEWLKALEPLGTDANKPFLETAPWLIAVFAKRYGINAKGERYKHYYTPESVGLASGFLLAALHTAGLSTLTHTPSPMGFLKKILKRPNNERAFLLVVAGHPVKDAEIPDLQRNPLGQILTIK